MEDGLVLIHFFVCKLAGLEIAVLRGPLGQVPIELMIEQGKFEFHSFFDTPELNLLRYNQEMGAPQRLTAFFYQTKSGNELVCDPKIYRVAT